MALALLVLVLLAAGCSKDDKGGAGVGQAPISHAGDDTATTVPAKTDSQGTDADDTGGDADPNGTELPAPKLDWTDCDGDFRCATVKLPLDYRDPGGKTIAIGVAERRAGKPKDKIGSLFVNPGGPGVSAIDFMEGVNLPKDITDHFDIIGVDPRGVGRSDEVDCDEAPGKLYAPDPSIDDPADKSTYLQVSQAYVDKCAERNGDLLDHVGTRDTVRDMDQIRKGLGAAKLDYLGFSYGTALGETYADLFPTKIRAMVLDGVVDLSVDGPEGAAIQAKGFQLALDHFLADCKAKGASCPIGPDPTATLAAITKKTEAAPIPSKTADRAAGPGELSVGLADALYSESAWPQLADALASADKGDGSGLVDLADDYLQVSSGTENNTSFDGYFAIGCVDQAWPRNADTVFADGVKANVDAPDFGESITNDYIRCALWPAKADPLTPPKATGSPAIVVVGTTGDPATPYESSVALAKELPKGRLLTYDGEGHTAFGTSTCVTDAVTTYLVDLKLPAKGKVCKD